MGPRTRTPFRAPVYDGLTLTIAAPPPPPRQARVAAERLGPYEREALRLELRLARTAERLAARRAAEQREREVREAASDARRGPLPAPARRFRAPAAALPELLELWGLLSAFAGPMEIPPFSFESLEAALCPGPFPQGVTPYDESAAGGDGEGGDVKMADAAAAAASDGCAGRGPTPIDPACTASGLLLRDVHLALLRCVDATLHKPGGKCPPQPLTARYVVKTGHGIVISAQHWSQRAAATVHSFAHETTDAAGAVAAALDLYQTDYADLPLASRLAILRALTELALGSEALREHVSARMDAPVSAFKAARPRLMPGEGGPKGSKNSAGKGRPMPGSDQPDVDEDANAAAARGPDPAAVRAWLEWTESLRLGLRRPLGVDLQGRRYWALGGGAGAWRVYVEAGPAGGDWGFYEGPALRALAEWLAAGGVECEAPLLRALATMPWPLKPGVKAPPSNAAAAAASAAAGQPVQLHFPAPGALLSSEEMVAARLEGYRGLTGPLVYGELNFTNGSIPVSPAARMTQGMVSLLGLVPFWARSAAGQAELGALVERVKVRGARGGVYV